MFALSQFIATSQHYFVAPMPCEHGRQVSAAGTAAASYADKARSSRLEETAMALATVLATLTHLSALVATV